MIAEPVEIDLSGVSPGFVEDLFSRWQSGQSSVDQAWIRYFEMMDAAVSGPSWKRASWPVAETDTLTAALDPTQMEPVGEIAAIGGPVAKPAKSDNRAASESAALDSIRAMMLIRAYRGRGHLAADLDPLGLARQALPADLEPSHFGFTDEDLDRQIYVGGHLGLAQSTVRELVRILRANYCGPIGLEYMHIADVEERSFLQERFEGYGKEIIFGPDDKKEILAKLIQGVEYERFLGKKYVGTTRFGLNGAEAALPAIEAIIRRSSHNGVTEVVIGMNHRGRLNVLTNVMRKPYRAVFSEFAGGSANPEDVGGAGDVKYHLGTSTDREIDGRNVHLSLASNPSHLEAVDPVVLGKARAKQTKLRDKERALVLPLLVHGDAAFAGQGIVMECFGFSGLRGYNTGGSIHIIINNQVGFTTSPQFARSSPYPSDIAKMVQAPILHVNGDDPEAVAFASNLAVDFRTRFKRDVVIDMWCYRLFGHNEGDEPSFTQPLMYEEIRRHSAVSDIYGRRLKGEGIVDDIWIGTETARFVSHLEEEFEAGKSYRPNKADWFEGDWTGLSSSSESDGRRGDTAVEQSRIEELKPVLTDIPGNLAVHKTLARVLEAKKLMFDAGEGFDWATGEALAFGTLLQEGHGVRLSGQDCMRGTFSQRHAGWTDQTDGHRYYPLSTVNRAFEVCDSPLNEFGVMGFEYGYASAAPQSLVLWEAQFGDFANGAQVIVDQFIAASESKWLRANGLVLLLPHGHEGQGPEHSSARVERFLQLCADDNMQVANCTTPANYFHILRRQLKRDFRKPLVLMTPKSLLRHKAAISRIEDFSTGSSFSPLLADPNAPSDLDIGRLIFCTGKVGYDLLEARDAAGDTDIAIIRIEQLYPYPADEIVDLVRRCRNAKTIVWAQEEPRNAGAWSYMLEPLMRCLAEANAGPRMPIYAGRPASASTATGFAKRHRAEQGALVAAALGHVGTA